MPQLKDYVSDYPLYFVCGFIVWLPVAVWVMGLIHWMIQGDIDVISGLLGSVVAVTLGIFTMRPPVPFMAPLFLFAVLAILAVFPFVRNTLEVMSRELTTIPAPDGISRTLAMLSSIRHDPSL